jgi:hypothetical protein
VAGKAQVPAAGNTQSVPNEAVVRKNLMLTKHTVARDTSTDKKDELKHRQSRAYRDALNKKSTRKQFGVTRYEIAKLLANKALHQDLLPHEVRWLVDLGFRHISPAALARRLNTDLAGLELLLDGPESRVLANARARGIAVGHAIDPSDPEFGDKIEREADRENAEIEADTIEQITHGPGGKPDNDE